MLLWIAFALLTAAVLAWMLAPLARPAPVRGTSVEAGALAVYRDQLAEIEAERAAGMIGAVEAEAARLEISRRLLASAARSEHVAAGAIASSAGAGAGRANIALATAFAVPLLTLALYLAHGSPGTPSGSLATRADAGRGQAELQRMIAKVEQRLREAPGDGQGWEVVAPVYLKLGRFADAAAAYANAARLQGESVRLLAGRAEASMLAKDGIVTEEARTAYERILELEPGRAEPRFWLALAKEQDGRLRDALADYAALLKEPALEKSYRPAIETRIAEVSARLAKPAAEAPANRPAGPSAAEIEAAAKLTPEQRDRMVTGMVDGLAQRLKSDGKDLPGWQRLINAYAVLGRRAEARAALAEARRNFEGDAGAIADLSRLAATLGLGS